MHKHYNTQRDTEIQLQNVWHRHVAKKTALKPFTKL
jgi:hypothetical protein